jgi:hypothetical protein
LQQAIIIIGLQTLALILTSGKKYTVGSLPMWEAISSVIELAMERVSVSVFNPMEASVLAWTETNFSKKIKTST